METKMQGLGFGVVATNSLTPYPHGPSARVAEAKANFL